MEGYVRLDGEGFDVRLRVNWRALTAFISSADVFVKAVKATILVTFGWLVLRLALGW
jgi:hypothetical protein